MKILAVFEYLFTFSESLFLQNVDETITNNYADFRFGVCRTLVTKQNICAIKDVLDANRFKILTEIVLELDVSPKYSTNQ